MIKSMTGYGQGESMGYDWKCTVEIKAVNHRYCDISIRIPPIMNSYEDRVRKILAQEIRRGKIDVYIRTESFGHELVKVDINVGMADAYMKALHKLTERYPLPDQTTLYLLSTFPEVFLVDKTVTDETRSRIWTVMERTVYAACAQLTEMRQLEGTALRMDILAKTTHLADLLKALKSQMPQVALDYEKRLRNRIDEVLSHVPEAEVDESRLLGELALYADKSCVDEEVMRFESHLQQLGQIVAEKGAVGRKLDFLIQELQREINTIGSKTGDIVISKLVIDMKSEIEKIREQVQNVE